MRPQHGPWRRCCCTPTLTYGPTFPFVQFKPPEAGERIRAVLSGAGMPRAPWAGFYGKIVPRGLSTGSGRVAMHDFIKRFANGVFYPEEVQILVAVFDDAWSRLQSSHAPFGKFSRSTSSGRPSEASVTHAK